MTDIKMKIPNDQHSSGGFQQAAPSNGTNPDFSEFMWMAEEQDLADFDKKCEQEIMEELFIEQCFEELEHRKMQDIFFLQQNGQMLEQAENQNNNNLYLNGFQTPHQMQSAGSSQLNPLAPAFVPRSNLNGEAGVQR